MDRGSPKSPDTPLALERALDDLAQRRWRGRRSYARNMSQGKKAIEDYFGFWRDLGKATAYWYSIGLSPATINKRLGILAMLGVPVEGYRAHDPRKLKWWLTPQMQQDVTEWLRAREWQEDAWLMADYIDWTVWTGLRVEETLALRRGDIVGDFPDLSVTVPGLKTATAQATLPLCTNATGLLLHLDHGIGFPDDKVFRFRDYTHLRQLWETCRTHFGWDSSGATLKALRRSAARYLHVQNGMPLDMVRQYLRHEDIKTTMGYLRLTGGYGEEEFRRWLK